MRTVPDTPARKRSSSPAEPWSRVNSAGIWTSSGPSFSPSGSRARANSSICSPTFESRAVWVMVSGTLAAKRKPAGVFRSHERTTAGRGAW